MIGQLAILITVLYYVFQRPRFKFDIEFDDGKAVYKDFNGMYLQNIIVSRIGADALLSPLSTMNDGLMEL